MICMNMWRVDRTQPRIHAALTLRAALKVHRSCLLMLLRVNDYDLLGSWPHIAPLPPLHSLLCTDVLTSA